MEEPLSVPSDSNTRQAQTGGSTAALEQIKGLLSAKDDTSRFVGLALLKSVLDNRPELRQDVVLIKSVWEAIPAKFLDRLLRARGSQNVTRAEAKHMVDIAVSVIHTFAVILPADLLENDKLIGRSAALANVLVQSSAEASVLILQTLLTIVSLHSGALGFLAIEDVSPLTEIAHQQPLVLDIFSLAWSNASTQLLGVPDVQKSVHRIIPMLINSFRDTDAVTLLAFIANTFVRLPAEAMPDSPSWVEPLISCLKNLVTKRPTTEGRTAYTNCAAVLIQTYAEMSLNSLFQDNCKLKGEEKPFSYLFINLLLIDIRSSFPSLLSILNSPEYSAVSRRLAAAFDIVSGFISFLVRSLDEEDGPSISFSMPPDLLLKIRKEISETISVTIEYLRDRWDFSFAGVAGLHPSARTGTTTTSEGTRLTLTWESMKVDVSTDHLVLSGIRTLAIWLREDNNENLRKQAAGLMDMFTELYQIDSSEALDFRFPVLTVLESLIISDEGAESFINQGGWEILSRDLARSADDTPLREALRDQQPLYNSLIEANASRGIEIVRVLLATVNQQSTVPESWMTLVKAAASIKRPLGVRQPLVMELQISILQLAAELLSSATSGMQKRYVSCTTAILGLVAQLRVHCNEFSGLIAQEFRESLDDIAISLEDLR